MVVKHNRLILHTLFLEVVGQVQLGGGTTLDADSCPVKFFSAFNAKLLGDHEPLSVIVVDAGEVEAQRSVTVHGPGSTANQDIDLT